MVVTIEEMWKPLKNYEQYYMVSNFGRIKSLPRKAGRGYIGVNRIYETERIRKLNFWRGYLHFSIDTPHKKKSIKSVARAVIETFIPIPKRLLKLGKRIEVNHIDGNRLNNRLENLEWVTPSENHYHSIKIGHTPIGEKHYHTKLTNDDVINIKKLLLKEKSIKELSQQYNVGKSCIYLIKYEINWKHIKI